MADLVHHLESTWENVIHGSSSTAEKVEFGLEASAIAVAVVVASKFGLSKLLSGTKTADLFLPSVEVDGLDVASERTVGSVANGLLKREPLSTKDVYATLADVPPIESSNVADYTRATIPDIVEAPLVEAARVLYDKNIQTVFSGANGVRNGVNWPAYIHINYETLSAENKILAEGIGTIVPRNEHAGSIIAALELNVTPATAVADIKSAFLQKAAQFRHQPLTWGHWSSSEYGEHFGLQSQSEITEWVDGAGHAYDQRSGRIFLNHELAEKYSASERT